MTTSSLSFADAAPQHLHVFMVNAVEVARVWNTGDCSHGISRIQIALGTPCREQRMFFHTELTQSRKVAPVPRQMGVGISQPRHQGSAAAVELSNLGIFLQLLFVGNSADGREPFTFVRISATTLRFRVRYNGRSDLHVSAIQYLPSMRTSPRYGSLPVESRIETSSIKIFESGWVPWISYFLGLRRSSNLRSSMYLTFRGGPSYGSSLEADSAQETVQGSPTTAGAMASSSMQCELLLGLYVDKIKSNVMVFSPWGTDESWATIKASPWDPVLSTLHV